MIFSMTGFAASQSELPTGTLLLELRTINHRYLETHFRLDDSLRFLEPLLRDAIAAKLSRGKVECRVALTGNDGVLLNSELNNTVIMQLAELSKQIQSVFPQSAPLSTAEILRWPGVIATENLSSEVLQKVALDTLADALQELSASRQREGEKLAAVILDRVSQMETLVQDVRPRLPVILKAYQDKLTARLNEVLVNPDDSRVQQELAIYAQKIDVDEELDRLTTHLQETRRILGSEGAAGKRLDFLMQELNREANTLGSKSVSTELTQTAMELKVLIEQIREQVQNIE